MSRSVIPIHTFFENYAEAVLITREDERPLLINSAFSELSGFGQESLSAMGPGNIFSQPSPLNSANHQAGVHWESGLIKKDGTLVSVIISLSGIGLSDETTGRVYTITGISNYPAAKSSSPESHNHSIELEEVKKELEIQAKELKRSKEELEQFAYVASHDLNEPLRMISGYIQLIEKKIELGNVKDLKEFMAFVTDGAARMQKLISDLLLFSRINREGNPFAVVDMNEVIKISINQLGKKNKKNDAQVHFDVMPKVQGDSSQLIQLITHLIENAVKFNAPDRKPEIRISVEDKGVEYLFKVKDNGIGIERKFYDRIFVIFQRLHSRSEYEGTGLGLAMCKRIAGRHGGDIWVESETGQGSTFYFTLKK